MISTYGGRAEQAGAALPPDLDAVVFDETGLTAAFLESVRRRECGERFYGLAVFDDVRVSVCNAVALEINRNVDREQRQGATAALAAGSLDVNGEPVVKLWHKKDGALWHLFSNVLMLAEEMLVRSYSEYSQYCTALYVFHRRFRRVLLANTVPPFAYAGWERPSAVVWTGRRPTATATLALIGLEEFRGDVTYVGDHPLPNIAARFVGREDPALPELLAGAGCVVCVDPADPADAVGFARRGVPVVAPATCAAYEFADGILSWDAANAPSLSSTVALAVGRAPSAASADSIPPRPLSSSRSGGVPVP